MASPMTRRVDGTPPQHRFAGDRKLSGAGAEEKDLGVLMDEKSGMCKCPAAYKLANAEERLDIKISGTEKSSGYI
ncbi:hypothetical protein DUI87_08078 [Hirundo rustica rustica]|uniref:Uncharacterized protein n=1 Tax=Hirundo rustica rustica TaxID=333673 RepID=A0A3M0KRU5_HIRRU|nr:hypothetical protein DUI87_08078 [Hirundo rustica rustica]